MDREKLLQMAEESGLLAGYEGEPDRIARFAELVRADKEREIIGSARISIPTEAMEQEIAARVRRAVEREREECAKVCDALPASDRSGPWFNDDMSAGAMECARAIRARGKQEKV